MIDNPTKIFSTSTGYLAVSTVHCMEPRRNCILVVEDYPVFLDGMVSLLQGQYPQAKIMTARSVQEAWTRLKQGLPDVAIFDLAIPESAQDERQPQADTGIKLLKRLMDRHPDINLVVQSTYLKSLVRLSHKITEHRGGFAVIEKSRGSQEVLALIDATMQGFSNTQRIRQYLPPGIELKPEWHKVLLLASKQGLQDKAIAKRMHVQIGTIRHYWCKLYDVLDIDPKIERDAGRNLRSLAEIRAREKGLID